MLWLKAIHIIALITWFAGLFYLPRLYMYHASAHDTISQQRFIVMERRLFIMASIGGTLTLIFGIAMLIGSPAYLAMGWLRVKLLLVLLVIGYHGFCFKLLRDFASMRNKHSGNWYRGFNEVLTPLLILIVILAVVKPF
jgi:protoporphyrinogen IX oxidase